MILSCIIILLLYIKSELTFIFKHILSHHVFVLFCFLIKFLKVFNLQIIHNKIPLASQAELYTRVSTWVRHDGVNWQSSYSVPLHYFCSYSQLAVINLLKHVRYH